MLAGFATCCAVFVLSGCGAITDIIVEGDSKAPEVLIQDECSWVRQFEFSDEVINALPDDALKSIVAHNCKVSKFCHGVDVPGCFE